MYLRSLEMQGFKSFPDKTTLTFSKGISAVVGPNGSGKSNIGDAMRWVMGEKSSKSLRGKTMEDVIFSGTLGRPGSAFAQVILTIDNEDGELKNESQIVSVSRKLYRNGDSEYQINGKTVRLKDIDELFMDTGLGKDGYSIIGQGKIGEIVSSKSADRRQIFDEAAGISKFRSKKEETERELLRTEENISRLTDIMSELESRLGPLEKQAEKARLFRTLDAEKSAAEISIWTAKLSGLISQQSGYEDKLSALSEQYEQISSELDAAEELIEKGFAAAAYKGDEVSEYRRLIHETQLRTSQAAAETAVLQNDIGHLSERINQLSEAAQESENSSYFIKTQLSQSEKELAQLEEKRKLIQFRSSECEAELSGAAALQSRQESEIQEKSDELNRLYLSRSNASFRLENVKNAQSAVLEEMDSLRARQSDLVQKIRIYQSDMDSFQTNKKELDEKKTQLINRIAGFEKLLETRSEKRTNADKDYSDADMKLREANQKLSILCDLEKAMEGFSYSVKNIVKASEQGRISGVCGSVAQLISVEPGYSTAIETALGSAMQNVVVQDENAAKRAIRLLKETGGGRATFLPLTTIRARSLGESPEGEDGFIAVASKLVTCDDKYREIVENLLGRAAVAEDIDSASQIAARHGYRFRIVTLDGQVVNAGGSYTGGSVSKSAGILTRKNEISELRSKILKLGEELSEKDKIRKKLSAEEARLSSQLSGEKEVRAGLEAEEIRLDMEIKRIGEQLELMKKSAAETEEDVKKQENLLGDYEKQTDASVRELSDADAGIAKCEEELGKLRGKGREQSDKRRELSDRLSDLRIEEAELCKDTDSLKEKISSLKDARDKGKTNAEEISEKIRLLKLGIAEKQKEIESLELEQSGSSGKIAEIEEKIAAALSEQRRLNAEAEKSRSGQKNKMNERESLSGDIARTAERLESVGKDFDKLAAQLWDEYGLTRSEAEEKYPPPENMTAANARLSDLRSQIKALGDVNPGAVEEYAEVSGRYEFMLRQLDDVNRSKLELSGLIDSLTEEMKTLFTESFSLISKSFSEIFKELFGGGKAELSLTDPENVLQSGIDIDVAPPGKVVKNLMSLSGGEIAFVAVCIYFAILTVRPSPFCVLDEIEAALDDVNVSKYASYLHRFTDKTQFITITHRRGSMEEADVLYGVTMQEDGVSKLLKMDMNEMRLMKFN